MKITFCGATERVTGSNYLIDTGKVKFLVDCGLFQGDIEADKKNWDDFKYDPKTIDFIIVTHSHLDHIGRLPLLYKRGFRGKVFSTGPTKDFSKIFLEDSCGILGDLAMRIGKEPLYDINDVEGILSLYEVEDYYKEFSPSINIKIKFHDAGHILGSAIIQITIGEKVLVFSGDLGNPPVPILKDTDFIPQADYIVMESTYGGKSHEPFGERRLKLERIIEETIKKNGTLLIPSFALERTQEIIYELNELTKNARIKKIPIYLDSPLAIKATRIYSNYKQYFDIEAEELARNSQDIFQFPGLKYIETREESKAIDMEEGAKIIIAGSGMSTGGRILYHEKRFLSDPNTTLLIVGYQVKGTLGRALADNEKNVEIMGENIPVNAKVEIIESYSAHADQPRLMYWLSKIKPPVSKIFLTHGEVPSQEALLHKIEEELGINVYIPKLNDTIEL